MLFIGALVAIIILVIWLVWLTRREIKTSIRNEQWAKRNSEIFDLIKELKKKIK